MPEVWLPFQDAVEWSRVVPTGVPIRLYDGLSEPPPSVTEVEFFVLPYMAGAEPLTLLPRMRSLQVLQTLTAGVNGIIDLVPPGTTLCNARGVHDNSTAELAMALLLAAQRQIDVFARAQLRGEWLPSSSPTLEQSTVLVLGFGGVGVAIHQRLVGFECHVLPVARQRREGVHGMSDLPGLLPKADVVILAVPETASTRQMVDASFLARMKDGALLVNVSRGPIVRTADLIQELRHGRLRAALDVTDPEPLPADHPLWALPGVLISPHVGGNTNSFMPKARRLVEAQLARYFGGQPLENIVEGSY